LFSDPTPYSEKNYSEVVCAVARAADAACLQQNNRQKLAKLDVTIHAENQGRYPEPSMGRDKKGIKQEL